MSHAAPSVPARGRIRLLAAAIATLLASAGLLAGTATPAHADPEERYGIPLYIDAESGGRAVWDVLIPDSRSWGLIFFPGSWLPAGLDVRTDPSGDVYVVGTAPPPGSYPVHISASRPGIPGLQSYVVEIRSASPITWGDPVLPQAAVGSTYDIPLSDTRAWETFSTTDPLPPGLTLTSNGRLTGTPAGYGTFSFTVTAQRSWISYQRTFQLRVTQGSAPVWSTTSIARLQAGLPANVPLVASDTMSVALVSGALPAGLTLSGATLTGTPTTPGPYEFTLAADGPGGTTNQTFTGFVRLPAVTWVTPDRLSFPRGVPVEVQLEASNATEFDVWAGELPAGLELESDGRLHGTPTQAGIADAAIVAGHRDGSSVRRFQFAVTVPAFGLLTDDWFGGAWPPDIVEADASGLAPSSPWALTLHPSGVEVAAGLAGADGIAVVDEGLEVDVPFGAHELRFTATAADGSPITDAIWFSVGEDGELLELSLTGPVAEPQRSATTTPAAVPASRATSAATLAATGVDPTGWLVAAALLALAGVAGVLASAHRREPTAR